MSDINISGTNDAVRAYNKASGAMNSSSASKSGFADMVSNVMDSSVSTLRKSEEVASSALVNDVSMEELAVSITNAEMTLKTVVAVRDRIISAYQDIMKMPI